MKFASMKEQKKGQPSHSSKIVSDFNPTSFHLPDQYKPRNTLDLSQNTQNTTQLSTNMSNINPNASIIQGTFSKDNPYFQKASAWEKKKKDILTKQAPSLAQYSKPPLFQKANGSSKHPPQPNHRYLAQKSLNTVSLNTDSYTTQYTPLNQETIGHNSHGISNVHLISKDTGGLTPGKTPTRKIAFYDESGKKQLKQVVQEAYKVVPGPYTQPQVAPSYGQTAADMDYYQKVDRYSQMRKEKGKIKASSRRSSMGTSGSMGGGTDYYTHPEAAEVNRQSLEQGQYYQGQGHNTHYRRQ